VKKYGPCFTEGEMITVSNMNVRARSFALNGANEDCKKRHGGFETKWILFNEGKIIGMVPKDSVKQVTPNAPDAGAPAPAPKPAPAAAAAPDAG
jgi:hypothetical protein